MPCGNPAGPDCFMLLPLPLCPVACSKVNTCTQQMQQAWKELVSRQWQIRCMQCKAIMPSVDQGQEHDLPITITI